MLDFGPWSNLETTAEQRWTDVGLWTHPGPSSGVQPHTVVSQTNATRFWESPRWVVTARPYPAAETEQEGAGK